MIIVNSQDVINALKERNIQLELALEVSLKLQSHYAELLNNYDSGKRMTFNSVEDWLERLRSTKTK